MKTSPLLAIIADWRALLDSDVREEHVRDLREHSLTRRPLGHSSFLKIRNTKPRRMAGVNTEYK